MKSKKSLRRQLILGISVTHAVLMSVFVLDLVERQKYFIKTESVRLSEALATVIASNSDTWLLARDFSGLQEIVESQNKIPNVTMAMVFGLDGRILAHTEPNRVGQFISNASLPSLFSKDQRSVINLEGDGHTSVIVPIYSKDAMLGKVWLDLSQEKLHSSLYAVARDGLIYTLLAVIIGIIMAVFLVDAITRRLNRLVEVAELVRTGNRKTRAQVSGEDEIGQLGSAFDLMLESLETEEHSLELANEKATLANRAKSDFLANMSHEIRTPINAMIGTADVLADTELSTEQRTFVKMFQRACDTLLNLVNDILDLSKIEAGEFRIINDTFVLKDLLDETIKLNSKIAEEKGISLKVTLASEIPSHLIGDAYRLRQVIQNLVSNALKFSDFGTITLFAQMKENTHQNKEGSSCLIKIGVEDQGIGIPEDKKSTLFERFHQIDHSATRKVKGTGLGLAISKRLVEKMGGSIHCESHVGLGSQFYFWIPLLCGSAEFPTHLETQRSKNEGSSLPPNHRNRKILLVDDGEDNRLLVRAFLKNTDVDVDAVENGELALQKFKENKYDLILLDLQMPVMDGYEAVRLMRKWESDNHRERTRIFALSADSITECVNRALSLGCDNHISKPVHKKTLLDVISQI